MLDSVMFNGKSTLAEMVETAKEWNAGSVKMVFHDKQGNPNAAVIVVREDTAQVLQAIERIENDRNPQEEKDNRAYAKAVLSAAIGRDQLGLSVQELREVCQELLTEIEGGDRTND